MQIKVLIPLKILIVTLFFISSCHRFAENKSKLYLPDHQNIRYTGRIDLSEPGVARMSGSAAYFEVKFKGSDCKLLLRDQNVYGENDNYLTIVLDGEYQGRIKVEKGKTGYLVAENLAAGEHTLLVAKATEAQNGYVDFLGLHCRKLLPPPDARQRKIEFIGNSITCGMGLDLAEVPCDSGKWFDQHNAYLAYGSLAARALNADWFLSSVSGIGMQRNWNSPGPTMPQVYENTFLNTDSTQTWDFSRYGPDLVSICLGQNDFSEGDGSYNRAELDSAAYVEAYIGFIKTIRSHYPTAQIACLTSPMLDPRNRPKLSNYIMAVVQHIREVEQDKKIAMFAFEGVYQGGCSYHPSQEEHEKIAQELLPFYKEMMNWN